MIGGDSLFEGQAMRVVHVRDRMRRLSVRVPSFDAWCWREGQHVLTALLNLLEYDWKNNSALIKRDVAVRKQFSTILKVMLDRQISRAKELRTSRMMIAPSGLGWLVSTGTGLCRASSPSLDDHLVSSGPGGDVALLNRGGHQIGEQVGGAGEGRGAEFGHLGGELLVEAGGACIVEGQQADHLDPAADYLSGLPQQFRFDAAFVEVGDENEDRLRRAVDVLAAVADRPIDVGPTTELSAEEDIDRIVQLVGQVDDLGIEHDQPRGDGSQ